MVRAEAPVINIINTPGEINRIRTGFAHPFEVSPHLREMPNVEVVNLADSRMGIVELAKQVADTIHTSEASGFVVTTRAVDIQYVAPRLAFAFGPNLDKTVVVTGSNISAEYGHSKAREEFVKGVITAQTPFNEVVVAFEDRILRATTCRIQNYGRSTSVLYETPGKPFDYLGEIGADGVYIKNIQERDMDGEDTFHNDFETKISVIPITPGLEPEFYRESLNSRGVVIESVAWNIPTRGEYSFVPLISELVRNNIPVMLTSKVIADRDSALQLLRGESIINLCGGVSAIGMSHEVAIAKFSWAIRRVDEEIASGKLPEDDRIARVNEIIKTPYVGEFGLNEQFNNLKI